MVLHNFICKKIRERIFERKSMNNIWAKISFERKKDKGIKAFNAFSETLGNSSVIKNSRQLIFCIVPHNHIWKKITVRICERKPPKEYSKANPRKNIRKLSRIFFRIFFWGISFKYSFADFLSNIFSRILFRIFFRGFTFMYSFSDIVSNILSRIFFRIFFRGFSFVYFI